MLRCDESVDSENCLLCRALHRSIGLLGDDWQYACSRSDVQGILEQVAAEILESDKRKTVRARP